MVTDLREQKKNEEIIAEGRLAQLVIEQASETIIVCDTLGRIIRFSNNLSKLCECDPTFQRFEDIIELRFSVGKSVGKSIFPVSSSLKGSTIIGVEATFELKNCQKFYFLLNSESLKNTDGKVIGCLVTLTDITERKLMETLETALLESRAKLEVAFASMTDAVLISDNYGRFIDFNDAFATFHKFKNKEECSKIFDEYPDILDVFMADGTPAPLDMWALPRALRGEMITDVEYILRRKDTGETWVGSYSFAPIRDKDGAIFGSVVIGRDITKRKQVEEERKRLLDCIQREKNQLSALINSIADEVWFADSKKNFTLINSSGLREFGINVGEISI